MNVNEVLSDGKWLKAPDLKGRKVKVRISDWSTEDFKQMNGTTRKQIVLSFHGAEKQLGLNVTNARMIASMHGDETDGWIGKEIILFPTKTNGPTGGLVDCIRVEYAEPPKPAKRAAKPQPQHDERNPPPADEYPDGPNDEVPF